MCYDVKKDAMKTIMITGVCRVTSSPLTATKIIVFVYSIILFYC